MLKKTGQWFKNIFLDRQVKRDIKKYHNTPPVEGEEAFAKILKDVIEKEKSKE